MSTENTKVIGQEIFLDDIPKGESWFNSDLEHSLNNDRHQGEGVYLRLEGYVGNRPVNNNDEIHEDDTWAIDVFDGE